AKQRNLASARLENALDLLEPLSMEVRADYLAKTQDGQYFRGQFALLTRAFYQRLLTDANSQDRNVRRQVGRALHGLGMSHEVLKQGTDSIRNFEKAVEVQELLVNEYPEDIACRVDLALGYQSLGDASFTRGDKAQAEKVYSKILTLFQELRPGNDRITL